MSKKGNAFFSRCEKRRMVAYARLSAKEKLEWLYEASEFCKKAIRGRTRKNWESFGRGLF